MMTFGCGRIGYDPHLSIDSGLHDADDPNDMHVAPADLGADEGGEPTAAVLVSPTSGLETRESGETATFDVVLASAPTSDVSIALASSDESEGTPSPATLRFTSTNWNAPQSVVVAGVDDSERDGNTAYTVLLNPCASADAAYNGIDPDDVDLTNVDDESPGVTLEVASPLVTSEAGTAATFAVRLNAPPAAEVSIALDSDDATEGVVSPSTIVFTEENWASLQTVTLTGIDDTAMDGDVAYHVVTSATVSADVEYADLVVSDVDAINLDDETPGFVVAPTSGLTTTEAGGTAAFTVVLRAMPAADVSVAVASSDASEVSASTPELTFTSLNWDLPQAVTLTGVDDSIADGNQLVDIAVGPTTSADPAYDGLAATTVRVRNDDDESAGLAISPTTGLITTEGGGTATFSIALRSAPSAAVTLSVSSALPSEGTAMPALAVFTPSDWNVTQPIVVHGVDDSIADGDRAYEVVVHVESTTDADYSSLADVRVDVTNIDDESAGVTVAPTSGLMTSEAGTTSTFTVVLNSQPTDDVTFSLESSAPAEGTVSPTSLTFGSANWNAPQIVTVTGIDDPIDDGDRAFEVLVAAAASADPSYDGIDPHDVAVINADDDAAGIMISPTAGLSTTEFGGTATFSVQLQSEPTAAVAISISSSDATEGSVAPAMLTFTSGSWNLAQVVTVTGVNDAETDGNIAYAAITAAAVSTDASYAGLDPSDVALTNVDDEVAGVVVSPSAGLHTTESGGSAMFALSLAAQPTSDVSVSFASSDASEGTVSPASVTFTTLDWNVPQPVVVTGVADEIDDGDVDYMIVTGAAVSADGAYAGMAVSDVAVTNDDDDDAGVSVAPTSGLTTTEAGGTATFTVVLDSQPTAGVSIALSSSNLSEGTVSPGSVTFTTMNWNVPQTVTATGVNDTIVDGDVPFTIVTGAAVSADPLYSGRSVDDVAVTNADNDMAGVTVSPTSGLLTTEAGGTAMFSVVLDAQPSASVVISLASSNTLEGTVTPASVTFTALDWSTPQVITVTGVNDPYDDGDVAYSVVTGATVSGDASFNALAVADVSITNSDNDTASVTVSPTSGLTTTEVGATAMFTVVLTAQPAADVVIGVSSGDATEGTASPASLTFTSVNWNIAQTVVVTGVDDLLDDGNVAYSVITAAGSSADAAYNGLAVSDVSLTNTDNDTAGVTLSSASPHWTGEDGETSSFTVVLLAQPASDVTIALSSSNPAEGAPDQPLLTFTNANWNTPQTVTIASVQDLVIDGDVAYTIVTGATMSSDAAFNGLAVADVTVTGRDDDAFVFESDSAWTTDENGTPLASRAVMVAAASATVSFTISVSDAAEGSVPLPVFLTPCSAGLTCEIPSLAFGVDDFVVDGTKKFVYRVTASSADATWNGKVFSSRVISNLDNDSANILVTPNARVNVFDVATSTNATVTLRLTRAPSASVTVGLSSSDSGEITVSPASMVFTPGNWSVGQVVTLTGVADSIVDGNQPVTIVTAAAVSADGSFAGINPVDIAAEAIDYDARRAVDITTSSSFVVANFAVSYGGSSRISSNGRYVPFTADSNNYIVGDTNGNWDVFVRDRTLQSTARVSVTDAGAQASSSLGEGFISSDGRYVAFWTSSPLVAGDTLRDDVYVRDTGGPTTYRVSLSNGGAQLNGDSYTGSISANGRYVTFASTSSNAVVGDTNGVQDLFMRDTVMATTVRVSVGTGGVQGTTAVSAASSVSDDGRYVAFSTATSFDAADTNGVSDIYLRDTVADTTTLLSVTGGGVAGNGASSTPAMTGDARYIVYQSAASDLVAGDTNGLTEVFLRDRMMGTTERICYTDSDAEMMPHGDVNTRVLPSIFTGCRSASISSDGSRISFLAQSADLTATAVHGVPHVYVRDRTAGSTTLVSRTPSGAPINLGAYAGSVPAISGDGTVVTFVTWASDVTGPNIDTSRYVHQFVVPAF